MKVSLVVATGAHEGRAIPLTGAQFLIGRDPQCNLRPASPAISKVHCAVVVRDGKLYVKDCGSTNGTLVNGELIQDREVPVEDGASIQLGPLDFRVRVEKEAAKADGTPLPGDSPETAAALAAVKAATATAAPKAPASRDTTPAPAKSGVVPQPAAKPAAPKPAAAKTDAAKPAAPTKPGGTKEASPTKPAGAKAAPQEPISEDDRIAAMLLGMDDEGNDVPDGSTVMDIPTPFAVAPGDTGEPPKPDDKKTDAPKKAQTREEMSTAANDLLLMYKRKKEAPKK